MGATFIYSCSLGCHLVLITAGTPMPASFMSSAKLRAPERSTSTWSGAVVRVWKCMHIYVYMYLYICIYTYIWSPPNDPYELCGSIINTIFCMQLCLVRNRKHCSLQYFLLFGLYSNCVSYVLVLFLRAQKLKTDSVFKIPCLPYAYTYTYIPMHIQIHIHMH